MNASGRRFVFRNDGGSEIDWFVIACQVPAKVNYRFINHPQLVWRGIGLEKVTVDPPKIFAEGVEVDHGLHDTAGIELPRREGPSSVSSPR